MERLGVRRLKDLARAHSVPLVGCTEKRDIVGVLRTNGIQTPRDDEDVRPRQARDDAKPRPASASPSPVRTEAADRPVDYTAMKVSRLRQIALEV